MHQKCVELTPNWLQKKMNSTEEDRAFNEFVSLRKRAQCPRHLEQILESIQDPILRWIFTEFLSPVMPWKHSTHERELFMIFRQKLAEGLKYKSINDPNIIGSNARDEVEDFADNEDQVQNKSVMLDSEASIWCLAL